MVMIRKITTNILKRLFCRLKCQSTRSCGELREFIGGT
jgi:hypothetical protein